MMKRAILTLTLLLLSVPPLAAQESGDKPPRKERPDLNGTWLADKNATKGIKYDPHRLSLVRLVIQHTEPEIKITRVYELDGKETIKEQAYYSDRRGETNVGPAFVSRPGELREEEIKSETRWDGRTLVIRATRRLNVGANFMRVYEIAEWKLSSDGETITETTRVRADDSDPAMKFVAAEGTPKRVFRRAGK